MNFAVDGEQQYDLHGINIDSGYSGHIGNDEHPGDYGDADLCSSRLMTSAVQALLPSTFASSLEQQLEASLLQQDQSTHW